MLSVAMRHERQKPARHVLNWLLRTVLSWPQIDQLPCSHGFCGGSQRVVPVRRMSPPPGSWSPSLSLAATLLLPSGTVYREFNGFCSYEFVLGCACSCRKYEGHRC